MGRYTSSVVAPFVRRGIDVTRFVSHLCKEFFAMENEKNPPDSYITYKGWSFYFGCAESFKDHNKNELYCNILEKNDLKIYTVNEDQYAAGGAESHCLFSKSEADLLELCEDIELDPEKIRYNDIVQKTS